MKVGCHFLVLRDESLRGAASGKILPAQADGGAVIEQRGEAERYQASLFDIFNPQAVDLSVKFLVSRIVQIAHEAGFFQHPVGGATVVVT